MASRRQTSLAEKFYLEGEARNYEVTHQNCICHYGDKAKQLSDLQLTSSSKTFNVNKLILCYQSRYFERKLMEDGPPTKTIVVNNIDDSTMELIIEFLYHHQIDINQSNIINLFAASSFLQIKILEEFCLDYLTGVLEISNFVTISSLSHYYRNNKLKQAIAPFLLTNFEAIITTEKFKNMDKGEALDMLTIPTDKKGDVTEEMLYDAINLWASYDPNRRESYKVDFYQILDFSRLPADFGVILEDDYLRKALEIKQLEENRRNQRVQESLYIIGGTYTARHLYKVHLDTKKCTKFKDLPFTHIGGGVVVKNDEIYCCGGWPHERHCGLIEIVDKIEVGYLFHPIKCLHEARLLPALTVVNGEDIYVTGGWDGTSDLKTCECYKQSQWNVEYDVMETTKSGHAVCYIGGGIHGRIVSFGGKSNDIYLSNMEIYRVEHMKHTNGTNMNCKRYGLTGEVVNEQIFAIGGYDGYQALDSVEKYERGRWIFVESMKCARYHHASAVVNNSLYVVGGFGADTSGTTVEYYDVNVDIWTIIISNLPEQFIHHSLISLKETNEISQTDTDISNR